MSVSSELHLGIDLGGTKTELIALDSTGHELLRIRRPTPKGDYPATVANIVRLIEEAEARLAQSGTVGIGIPGALSRRTGRVKNANSTWLIGQDLKGDLMQALQRPVVIENDANCFVLSEATDGAAAGAEVVFGVIIGTGCGGGIVVKGQVLTGLNAIAGEWGHNPLPWKGPEDVSLPCYCGQQGCVETFLSGPGMARHYQLQHGLSRPPVVETLVRQADEGDERARTHLERYCIWLARGLAGVINLLDPDVIVLGGGLSNIPLLYERVPRLWQRWVFSDTVETRLLPPRFGDSSGVRGAAWLGAKSAQKEGKAP